MLQYNPTVSGSLVVTGSLLVTRGITGSFSGSIAGLPTDTLAFSSSLSTRITATEATSSAYVSTSGSLSTRVTAAEATASAFVTASGSLSTRVTAAEATSSAFVVASSSFSTRLTTDGTSIASINAKTGSFATTGSNVFTSNQTISGSLTTTGTITAQTLVVQTITSSVAEITGSTQHGSTTANTHEFTGSVLVSGSINTSVGSGLIVGAGSYSNAPSSTRGVIQVNGSTDRTINFGPNDYIYNSDTLFRLLTNTATTNMDFVVGGVQRMFISGSGNIGIGTSSPIYTLDVNAPNNVRFYGNSYTSLTIATTSGSNFSLTNRYTDNRFSIDASGFGEIINFMSTGRVGIGTVSPNSLVEIAKSSNSGGGATFPRLSVVNTLATQGDGSSTYNFADLRLASGNGTVEMFLSTTYAAGTWAPAGILNVATNHDLQFKTNNTERMRILSTGDIQFPNSLAIKSVGSSGYIAMYANGGGLYWGGVAATNQMFLSGSGNLGIGTTTPVGKLHVVLPAYTNEDANANHAIFGSGTAGYGVRIGYGESANSGYINVLKPGVAWSNFYIQTGTTIFNIAGTERLRVNSSGITVGGSTTISSTLVVNSNTTTGTSAGVINLGTNVDPSDIANSSIIGITWGLRSDSNPYYIVRSNKMTYGSYNYNRLDLSWHTGLVMGASSIYGGTRIYNNSTFLGTQIVSIGDGDNKLRCTDDIIAYASDKRLKENITNIPNALDKLLKINGVYFDWKDETKDLGFIPSQKHDVGVIAQEIQAILPEVVTLAPFDYELGKSKSGKDYLTVKYEKIVPLLIESIKEQQDQIKELTNKISILENK